MAGRVRVVIRPRAINALKSDPAILASIKPIADALADEIRKAAPTHHRGAAASIHAEPAPDRRDGFRVSWDREHFYLSFIEYGTERTPARPFVRPIVDRFRR